jgi:RNA polymerase sigma-70 factor (ECF subfamily)
MSASRNQPTRASPGSPSDAELWTALMRDRSAGLAPIYDRYSGLVYGLGLAVLGQAQEAEDLAQEIFIALCERSDFDPARGSLAAFLATFTRSRAIDRLRSRTRRLRLVDRMAAEPDPAEDRPSALERISGVQTADQVNAALGTLPENQRKVLELAYFRGLSQTEIAGELGAPLGTVKSWARKGLLTLRGALGHLVE